MRGGPISPHFDPRLENKSSPQDMGSSGSWIQDEDLWRKASLREMAYIEAQACQRGDLGAHELSGPDKNQGGPDPREQSKAGGLHAKPI